MKTKILISILITGVIVATVSALDAWKIFAIVIGTLIIIALLIGFGFLFGMLIKILKGFVKNLKRK